MHSEDFQVGLWFRYTWVIPVIYQLYVAGNTGTHTGLQSLSLASNALDRFPNLRLLNHLEQLYIGGNFIEKIEAPDLKGLSSLQVSILDLREWKKELLKWIVSSEENLFYSMSGKIALLGSP